MRFTCRAYAVCTGTRVLFANHKNVLKDMILIGWVTYRAMPHIWEYLKEQTLLGGLWKRAQCWVCGERGRLEELGRDEHNQNILYKIIKEVIKWEKLAVFETRKYLCADLNPQTGIVFKQTIYNCFINDSIYKWMWCHWSLFLSNISVTTGDAIIFAS